MSMRRQVPPFLRDLHALGRGPANGRRIPYDLLDLAQRLWRQLYVCGWRGLFDLTWAAGPDDGDISRRVGQHPGDGQLRHRDALPFGHTLESLDDRQVACEEIALEGG